MSSQKASVTHPAERNVTENDAAREASIGGAAQIDSDRQKEPRRDAPKPASGAIPTSAAIPMGMDKPTVEAKSEGEPRNNAEQLAPLFAPNAASEYRAQWVVVQQGFVDDPRRAVLQGDELVTRVMRNLAETFSNERATLESRLDKSEKESTEMLRVALRRYRSFFERLLSV